MIGKNYFRRADYLFCACAIWLALTTLRATAQPVPPEPPKFQPPRPPDPNADFDDPAEENLELGDAPNRLAAPPPPPPGGAIPPPVSDFRPAVAPSAKLDPGKPHFQLVEGEFWEKGKRRGRSSDNRDKKSR